MNKKENNLTPDNPPQMPEELVKTNFQEPDRLVGQTLDGRFQIEKNLTESGADAGGIGLVYLARDLKLLGREAVVKILQKEFLANEDVARKFLHEKEALIRLDHPNIVRILDSGMLSDGNPFMVMEFVRGYSLRRKLQNAGGRLALEEAAHIIESVAEALGAAHARKIIHRDIKPENIMLTPGDDESGAAAEFERVRLIDFGIARVEESKLAPQTQVQRGIGTILYMSPEQLSGKIDQTPAADIYSLAVVAYEMLTGKLPFSPKSQVDMYQQQKEGLRTLPRKLRLDLPKAASGLIYSALEFSVAKRPQDARLFGRELANALREKTFQTGAANSPDTGIISDAASSATHVPAATEFSARPSEEIASGAEFSASRAATSKNQIDESKASNSISTAGAPENPPKAPRKLSKPVLWILFALLGVTALASLIGFAYWQSGSDEKETTAANADAKISEELPARRIKFFLNVQKMRDGEPFEEPFRSSGQEIFESGYKFKMNFEADAEGFIYIFNEEKLPGGATNFNILYPTPKTNDGTAAVEKDEPVETGFNTFGKERGTEIVWLIWTKEKIDELETARSKAFDAGGVLKDPDAVRDLKDFIENQRREARPETIKDTMNQQTVVKGTGDAVVHQIELEHR